MSVEGRQSPTGVDIIVCNPDGKKRLKNGATTSDRGELCEILIPEPRGTNTYKVESHFQDREQLCSGKVYESLLYDITS